MTDLGITPQSELRQLIANCDAMIVKARKIHGYTPPAVTDLLLDLRQFLDRLTSAHYLAHLAKDDVAHRAS